MRFQFFERNRNSARNVGGAILLWWAHVQHDHLGAAYTLQQGLFLDRFQRLAATVEHPDDCLDFSKTALGERA